jgi:hypothetical protein
MLRSIMILLLLTIGLLACPLSNNANIQVTGVVTQKTFPGAPNYESIAQGDTAETFWFITAVQEMCFAPDGEFINSEIRLSTFQLLNNEKLDIVEGQRYIVTGKTFPATSGHHHSKVMIVVKSIEKI